MKGFAFTNIFLFCGLVCPKERAFCPVACWHLLVFWSQEMCDLILVLHSLALCPGAGHTVHLSFLLKSVRQKIGLTSPRALGALGLCAETFCWRKCSQNKGLVCWQKRKTFNIRNNSHLYPVCWFLYFSVSFMT